MAISTTLDLPGVFRIEEASNKAIRKLYQSTDKNKIAVTVTDEGVIFQPGDTIHLVNANRGVSVVIWVESVVMTDYGRFMVKGMRYAPDNFTDDYVSEKGTGGPGGQSPQPDTFFDTIDEPVLCEYYACDAYGIAMLASGLDSYWPFTDGIDGTSGTSSLVVGDRVYDKLGGNDLYVNSNSFVYQSGIVPNDCTGDEALKISVPGRLTMSQVNQPRFSMAATGAGIMGGVAKDNGSGSSVIIACSYSRTANGDGGPSISAGTFTGTSITISMTTNEFDDLGGYVTVHNGSQVCTGFPTHSSAANLQIVWATTGSGTTASTTATLYADWDRTTTHGTLTLDGELNTSGNVPFSEEVTVCSDDIIVNHVFIGDNSPSTAKWDALNKAWERNIDTAYVDPDPNCRP